MSYDPSAIVDHPARQDYFFEHKMKYTTYRQLRDDLILAVVAEVLADAGVTLEEIDVFALTFSGARNLHNGYLRLLPIAKERTNTIEIGLRIGHVGPADWFIGLHALRKRGALKAGDLVLMLGGGGGWTESATLLKVR